MPQLDIHIKYLRPNVLFTRRIVKLYKMLTSITSSTHLIVIIVRLPLVNQHVFVFFFLTYLSLESLHLKLVTIRNFTEKY